MFGNFAKLDSPRRLVQFWQNFQSSLVLLIPNCTHNLMITYTYCCHSVVKERSATEVVTSRVHFLNLVLSVFFDLARDVDPGEIGNNT